MCREEIAKKKSAWLLGSELSCVRPPKKASDLPFLFDMNKKPPNQSTEATNNDGIQVELPPWMKNTPTTPNNPNPFIINVPVESNWAARWLPLKIRQKVALSINGNGVPCRWEHICCPLNYNTRNTICRNSVWVVVVIRYRVYLMCRSTLAYWYFRQRYVTYIPFRESSNTPFQSARSACPW